MPSLSLEEVAATTPQNGCDHSPLEFAPFGLASWSAGWTARRQSERRPRKKPTRAGRKTDRRAPRTKGRASSTRPYELSLPRCPTLRTCNPSRIKARLARRPRLIGEAVEGDGVVAQDLALLRRAEAFHLLGSDLARVGEGAVGMRVVRGPQHVVFVAELKLCKPDRVVLKGHPEVALPDLARRHREVDAAPTLPILAVVEQSFVAIVHIVDEPRQPPEADLGEHQAYPAMAVENALGEEAVEGVEERRDEVLADAKDRRRSLGRPAGPGSRHASPDGCPSTNVEGDDRLGLVRNGPELVPLVVGNSPGSANEEVHLLQHAEIGDPTQLGDRRVKVAWLARQRGDTEEPQRVVGAELH